MANSTQQYQRPGAQSASNPTQAGAPNSMAPRGSSPRNNGGQDGGQNKSGSLRKKLNTIITALIILSGGSTKAPKQPTETPPSSQAVDKDASDEPDSQTSDQDIAEATGAEKFATPTGNIVCTISSLGVNCSIAKLETKPQENLANCQGFIGYTVELRATGVNQPCVPKSELPGAAG